MNIIKKFTNKPVSLMASMPEDEKLAIVEAGIPAREIRTFSFHDYPEVSKLNLDLDSLQYWDGGSFGRVFRVESKGKLHAVKAMTACADRPDILHSFLKSGKNEIHILQKLKHENIVKYKDNVMLKQNENGPICHIVIKTEFLDETLTTVSSKGDGIYTNENAFGSLVMQMCSALKYMQKKNIAHHDIKPSNIMVKHFTQEIQNNFKNQDYSDVEDFHYKLIDFGLAKIYESKESLETDSSGTEYYTAPEKLHATKEKPYNPFLSDLYSLGVVMLFVRCGDFFSYRYHPIQLASKREEYYGKDDIIDGLVAEVSERWSIDQLKAHFSFKFSDLFKCK